MTPLALIVALAGCAPDGAPLDARAPAPGAQGQAERLAFTHGRLVGNLLSRGLPCDEVAGRLEDLFGYTCDDPGEGLDAEACHEHLSDTCSGGSAPTRNGTYLGSFSLYVESVDGSLSDTCEGTAELIFDATASSSLSGVGECAFSGELVDALPDTYLADIDGDRVGLDALYGGADMDIDGMVIVDDWNGSFTDGDSMDSTLEGVFNFSGIDFSYSGGFDVSR